MKRKGSMIVLGEDEFRIEEGPARVTRTATKELLSDDNTAEQYYEGVRDMTFNDALGKPYNVPRIGRDALGNVIKVGKPMTFLDIGGRVATGSRAFYIYKRREVDASSPTLEDGSENPHYVPEHVQKGALLQDDGTPPNRTHFKYVFDEVGVENSEEAAIKAAEKLLKEKA